MSKPWPMVPLGEILAERKEIPFPADIENGSIRIVSKIGFKEGKIELRSGAETKTGMILIHPGDLVVSGINAAKGAIAIYGEENTEPIAATIHYGAYIPNKDRVDIKFLWWLLRSRTFRELLLEYVPGGIKTELKAKRLLPVPIPLPRLAVQQRIVVRIEELAAKIAEAKGLRQKAVEEAEALNSGLYRKVFVETERKFSDHKKLEDLVTIMGGGTPSKHNFVYWNGGIPWVSPKDMKVSDIFDSEDHLTQFALSTNAATLIPENAILVVVRSGILRRTIPVAINRVPVTINQDMKALLPRSELLPEYLRWWFRGKEASLLEYVKGGTTVQSLVWENVKAHAMCLPPLSDQRRIVAYLDDLQAKVDSLKRLQAGTAADLDAMLPSVLDRAFRGEM